MDPGIRLRALGHPESAGLVAVLPALAEGHQDAPVRSVADGPRRKTMRSRYAGWIASAGLRQGRDACSRISLYGRGYQYRLRGYSTEGTGRTVYYMGLGCLSTGGHWEFTLPEAITRRRDPTTLHQACQKQRQCSQWKRFPCGGTGGARGRVGGTPSEITRTYVRSLLVLRWSSTRGSYQSPRK